MLRVYARPGVAPACLRLQDAHGLDVAMMLAVLHSGASGRVPSPEQIQALDEGCRAWRQTVIRPLREARQAMKSHHWLASQPLVSGLRESVKEAELTAERIETGVLEQMLAGISPRSEPLDLDGLIELTVTVLDLYDPGRTERLPTHVETIASAVLKG